MSPNHPKDFTKIPAIDLNQVRIATPCEMSWNEMKQVSSGDDRIRHCSACKLNVHNISEMSKVDAEALLAKSVGGGRVCVRLMKRTDGTLITKDCPVGVKRLQRLQIKIATFVFSALAGLASFFSFSAFSRAGGPLLGKIAVPVATQPQNLTGEATVLQGAPVAQPQPYVLTGGATLYPPMLGDVAIMPDPTPAPTPEKTEGPSHIDNEEPYKFNE